MILTLLVWLYITVVCAVWGSITWAAIKKVSGADAPAPGFVISCFTGLITTGTLAFALNLLIPLSLLAHLILVFPVIGCLLLPAWRRTLLAQFRALITACSSPYLLLACIATLFMLSLSCSLIVQTDTLIYHGQAIRWMESYKAVPGIVHVYITLGFKSMWFAAQALFRFDFIGRHYFLFLNGCVVWWFLLLALYRITTYAGKRSNGQAAIYKLLAWTLLLAFLFVPWNYLRITTASASPDLICNLLVWVALYLYYKNAQEERIAYDLLASFFAVAAITVKMSAAPIILLPVIIVGRSLTKGKWKMPLYIFTGTALLLILLVAHLVIATGYPLFPSMALNVFEVDWKYQPSNMYSLQHYIREFARNLPPVIPGNEHTPSRPFHEWIPVWWRGVFAIDKMLLIVVLLLLGFQLVTIKKTWRTLPARQLIVLLVSLAGTVFWFLQAPSFRFGIGFLIPLAAVLLAGLRQTIPVTFLQRTPNLLVKGIARALPFTMLLYTSYRIIQFRQYHELVVPAGVKQFNNGEITCSGVTMWQKGKHNRCSFSPVPCVTNDCSEFTLRGKDVGAGFKKR